MSKAFTKENDNDDDFEPERDDDALPENTKNYMTPIGFSELQNELRDLTSNERPKIVETVRWAAGNGDRSENGDYIYGKKRLREIDRRIRYLTKRLESAEVVDPKRQQGIQKVFFGATVTYQQQDGSIHTVKIVGLDEADINKGKISWMSAVAKALLKSEVDDEVELALPSGKEILRVLKITYEL